MSNRHATKQATEANQVHLRCRCFLGPTPPTWQATFGELAAFITLGGLLLEYVVGMAAVARGFSRQLARLCNQDPTAFVSGRDMAGVCSRCVRCCGQWGCVAWGGWEQVQQALHGLV